MGLIRVKVEGYVNWDVDLCYNKTRVILDRLFV